MDIGTKDLLISFLIILLALCLLQILYMATYAYRTKELQNWKIALFPITTLILSMLFPLMTSGDNIWDLRFIPFILAGLYGGYKLGLVQMFTALTIRYLLGGSGFYTAAAVIIIVGIAVCVLSKYYLKMKLKQKLILSLTLLIFAIVISQVLEATFFSDHLRGIYLFEFFLVNILAIIISTILWEGIRTYSNILQNLIKAEKLQMVNHLAASISHEVRNPLTVTRGFIQLLSEEADPEKRKEFVDISLMELDRATDIISDYLTFAKPAIGKNEEINIIEEIQRSVNVIIPLANMNGVEIVQTIQDSKNNQIMLMGDRKKFQQCLINIIKNGIESMKKTNGGKMHIHLSSSPDRVQINISDQGVGMSQEQLDRLGQPYFTTKEKGTGLGLMVSYSIINGMCGRIEVNSEVGKGTCFSINLPK